MCNIVASVERNTSATRAHAYARRNHFKSGAISPATVQTHAYTRGTHRARNTRSALRRQRRPRPMSEPLPNKPRHTVLIAIHSFPPRQIEDPTPCLIPGLITTDHQQNAKAALATNSACVIARSTRHQTKPHTVTALSPQFVLAPWASPGCGKPIPTPIRTPTSKSWNTPKPRVGDSLQKHPGMPHEPAAGTPLWTPLG